ncbi:hypothetical protein Scep_021607 [Stephania cephalantha]|uniref:Pectin acetylesterase n=1 Tax=Stephania cephalantha TaxID=152367 RepID=A0AAP0F8U3_9MAGN
MEGKICWDFYIEGLVINADGNLYIEGLQIDLIALCQLQLLLGDQFQCFQHLRSYDVTLSVGDWFFDRVGVSAIDCPYPCDNTCHNLAVTQLPCSLAATWFHNRHNCLVNYHMFGTFSDVPWSCLWP